MYDDLWNSSAFDLVEMTNEINLLPRSPDDIANILNFTETPVYTPDFALDVTTVGQVQLIPSTDLGDEGDLMEDVDHSEAVRFRVANFVRRASIMNYEVEGARAAGTRSLKILEVERNKKLAQLRRQFDATKGQMRWESLFGPVLDCNGRILLDPAKQLGLQRTKVKLKLSDSANDINDQLVDVKERIEEQLGFTPTGYKLITTKVGNQKLRKSKPYKEQSSDPFARILKREDKREGVVFADNVEVRYFRPLNPNDTRCVIVPEFADWQRGHNAPSLSDDFAGTVMPLYVQKAQDKWKEGLEMKGSMRTITYCTRPDVNYEVEIVE